MRKELDKKIAQLAQAGLFYFLLLIITGILRTNMILEYFPDALFESARVSAYVGLSVSSVFALIVIGCVLWLLISCSFAFEFGISKIDIIDAFHLMMYVFMIFVIIKFIVALFFLELDLQQIKFSNEFIENLQKGNWYNMDVIINYLSIFTVSLVFILELYFFKGYKNIKHLLIIFIFMSLGFYFTTIDFY